MSEACSLLPHLQQSLRQMLYVFVDEPLILKDSDVIQFGLHSILEVQVGIFCKFFKIFFFEGCGSINSELRRILEEPLRCFVTLQISPAQNEDTSMEEYFEAQLKIDEQRVMVSAKLNPTCWLCFFHLCSSLLLPMRGSLSCNLPHGTYLDSLVYFSMPLAHFLLF